MDFNTTVLRLFQATSVANTFSDMFNAWEYSPQVRIHTNSIRIFVTYVLTVQGALGNVITMVVVSRNGLRTTTNILLFSLCFFDGLYSACSLAFLVIEHVKSRIAVSVYWFLLLQFSPILHVISQFAILTGCHIVAFVSFERFIAVCLPLTVSHLVTPLRVKCVVIVLLLNVVTLVSINRTSDKDYLVALVFINEKITRNKIDEFLHFRFLFLIYRLTLVTPLPLCVVVLCTSMTIVRLVFKRDMTNCSVDKKTSKEMRAVKLMLNVCVLYVIFLLPVTFLQVYQVLGWCPQPFYQVVIVFCYQLNASVNFIVYVIHSPKFSRLFKTKPFQKKTILHN